MPLHSPQLLAEVNRHFPKRIQDLADTEFSDIEKIVTDLAEKYCDGNTETIWRDFFWQRYASRELPNTSERTDVYHAACENFYSYWRTLKPIAEGTGTPADFVKQAFVAARRGYEYLLPYLVHHSESITSLVQMRAENGDTIAHAAIKQKHPAFIHGLAIMLKKMAPGTVIPVNSVDGTTILHTAAACRQSDLANFIWTESLCNLTAVCSRGTALHIAIREQQDKLVVLFAGKLATTTTPNKTSPLQTAARHNNLFAIEHLLANNLCDVNATNPQDGCTALHDVVDMACTPTSSMTNDQATAVVALLLKHGANDCANAQGITPFQLAVMRCIQYPDVSHIGQIVGQLSKNTHLTQQAQASLLASFPRQIADSKVLAGYISVQSTNQLNNHDKPLVT